MKKTYPVDRGDRRRVVQRSCVCALALVSAVAALAPITAMASGSGAEVPPAGPGYLTIQFGRSIEGSYLGKGCVWAPGFLTLAEVVADLQAREFSATTTVVVDRTGSTTELCEGGDIYASWPDLQALAADGWSFASDGMTHNDIVTMSRTGQVEESCGSLGGFAQHGLDGSGLFAYGDNKFSATIQKSIVEECYMYGRTYRGGSTIAPR